MTELSGASPPARGPDALTAGAVVGRYVVRQQIGQGGWATVYLAEHTQLGVQVALKVGAPSDDRAGRLLHAEASALARLQHPSIASVRDYGETDDGRPYFAMELLPGGTLTDLLHESSGLPWREAVRIALALAEGLAYAHARGVLHRDIKPMNVMLDQTGRPKLTDFGAAGLLTEEWSNTAVTQAGVVAGTPLYMAPEQLVGDRNSAATDVYGLGLLLYQMLFGVVPHEGPGGAGGLMSRRLTEPVNVPERDDMPHQLRALLERMLRRNQERRIASADEVASELRELLSLTATSATPSYRGTPGLAQSARRTSALLAGIVAGTMLVVLGGMLLATRSGASTRQVSIGLLQGVLLIVGGLAAGWAATHGLAQRRSTLERDAGQLLLGTKDRAALTRTIALEVDELIARTRAIDARVLGVTIVQMVNEYEVAKESTDRQAALMNATQLLEKLMTRLSPWYVRHDKAVAFAVSGVGVISGLVKITTDVLQITRAP